MSDFLQSVELFNWRTGQQCSFTSLPNKSVYSISVAMDGIPAYCESRTDLGQSSHCFKLDKLTKSWMQVSSGLLVKGKGLAKLG